MWVPLSMTFTYPALFEGLKFYWSKRNVTTSQDNNYDSMFRENLKR